MVQVITEKVESGAVNVTYTALTPAIFYCVTFRTNSAPTTTADVVVSYIDKDDPQFNCELLARDPSTLSNTDNFLVADQPVPLRKGDGIRVTYTNPNNRRCAVTIRCWD